MPRTACNGQHATDNMQPLGMVAVPCSLDDQSDEIRGLRKAPDLAQARAHTQAHAQAHARTHAPQEPARWPLGSAHLAYALQRLCSQLWWSESVFFAIAYTSAARRGLPRHTHTHTRTRARTHAHAPLPAFPTHVRLRSKPRASIAPHKKPWHHHGTAAPATSAPGLGSPLPYLHRDWAHAATSAPGLGSPLPYLHRDWAHPVHICTGTGLTPAASAPGLGSPCHICTGTGLAPATSAPGLGSPLPHLHRD
jgi:hypothetical protein